MGANFGGNQKKDVWIIIEEGGIQNYQNWTGSFGLSREEEGGRFEKMYMGGKKQRKSDGGGFFKEKWGEKKRKIGKD